MMRTDVRDMLADATLAKSVPQFKRGLVWCRTCGAVLRVDAFHCLRSGWPKCCGVTMTIDSPDEQRAFAAASKKVP